MRSQDIEPKNTFGISSQAQTVKLARSVIFKNIIHYRETLTVNIVIF